MHSVYKGEYQVILCIYIFYCSLIVLQHQVEIKDLNPWYFPLPSNLCSVVPGSNHDFMSSVYRVVVSSPVV